MSKEKGGETVEKKTVYGEYMKDKEFARLIAQEDLIMDVTEGFCKILEEKKLSRSKLAKLMGKTKGYISQLLGGKRNLTLRVLSDIAYHLGYNVRIVFRKRSAQVEHETLKEVWNLEEKKGRMPSEALDSAMDVCRIYGSNRIAKIGI